MLLILEKWYWVVGGGRECSNNDPIVIGILADDDVVGTLALFFFSPWKVIIITIVNLVYCFCVNIIQSYHWIRSDGAWSNNAKMVVTKMRCNAIQRNASIQALLQLLRTFGTSIIGISSNFINAYINHHKPFPSVFQLSFSCKLIVCDERAIKH